jgi:SOS-response transcriptional repressor LexA
MDAGDMEWIRAGLEKPGKSKSGLAKALHRSPSMVTSLLSGTRELKAREIAIIARYLEVEAPESPAPPPRPVVRTAQITGEVAGGVWTEPGIEFESIPTTVAVDARWPADKVYLLRVRGNSVNRQARDGDLVLCLDAFAAPRGFQSGDWVIAERKRDDGLVETTVKRVTGDPERGYKLLPDSEDPRFQEPIPLHDGGAVQVKAFVLEFIRRGTDF